MALVDQEKVEQELLWRRCRDDFVYFCLNYWKIPVPAQGASPLDFDVRPYQHELANILQDAEMVVVLKARQVGLTTVAVAKAFHMAFFLDDHQWLIVSANEDAARKALGRVKYGYSRLPAWMKERGPELESQSTQKIEWDNGSKIESLPSTAAAGRGDSVYGVIFDEAAHMQDAESVFGALEPLCYGLMIVFSTAHGMGNWFHERWLDSELSDSMWTGVFFPWHVVPGRDQAWYDKKAKLYRGQEWLFFQEYPQSAEEAFAKSGRVAISDKLLEGQDWCSPEFRYKWVAHSQEFVPLDEYEQDDVVLNVWRNPEVVRDSENRVVRQPNYVIFLDSAEGLAHGDYNAISVWDVNRREEVAAMETRFPLEYMGELLEALGYWYKTAIISVERNFTGLVPIMWLTKEANYPRMFRMPAYGKQKHGKRSDTIGWRTDVKTKPKMIHDFARALREDDITMHNDRFRDQMRTFVRDGKGSYNATEGKHDDALIATFGAWQALIDAPDYPTLWFDDEFHVVTWGDVVAMDFSKAQVNPLETPIGGAQRSAYAVRPSIQLTPTD